MFSSQQPHFLAPGPSKKSPIFFLLFMALVIQLLWATQGPIALSEGGLIDTDSYMRMNRVLYLVESGNWFDSSYPRSNAPYGEVPHWTRAVDCLLIVGAIVVSPFLPFSTALHWWGVLISPVFQVITLVGLMWLGRSFLNRDQLLIVGGIFILQPGVIGYYLVGRVDHHGILLCCLILLLGCTIRMSQMSCERKTCIAAGIIATIGVWVSLEFMIGLFVSMAFLGCCWVIHGGDWVKRIMIMALSLWGVATIVLLVERGVGNMGLPEYDRFSVVHWTLFSVLAFVWVGVWMIKDWQGIPATRLSRLLVGALCGLVMISVMAVLFPKFFQGPLVDVDPLAKTLQWDRVTETQPLITTEPWHFGRLLFMLGIALPGIPYLITLLRNERDSQTRYFWCMITLGLLVYLPLAISEMRWVPYAELLFVFPYAHLIHHLVLRTSPHLRVPWQGLVKAVIVMVGAFGFVVSGATLMAQEGSGVGSTTAADCPIKPLSDYLSEPTNWGDRARTIMAFVDFGPELLYRTPHRVIATPYHRNTVGVIDTYHTMTDTSGALAQSLITARQVNLILICPSSPAEPGYYAISDDKPTLYERLLDGTHPDWLHQISLPSKSLQNFRLFEVVNDFSHSR